jgi:uncharacterized protein
METSERTTHFDVATASGARLRGDLRWDRNGGRGPLPVVIVCHGFKAFKDWGPFPHIGQWFADQGFVSIVFNFSHNGIGTDPRKFTEHALFEKNTIGLEIDDVRTILDAIAKHALPCDVMDPARVGIVGHSRGGGVALITAHEDPRVHAAALWSSVSTFSRYSVEQVRRWREKGYMELHSVSGTSALRMGIDLLNNAQQNRERYDLIAAASHLAKPLLIVHGTEDIPVKIREAEMLYEAADKRLTQFVRLDGVGHMYGAKHPYRKESPTLTHILELTGSWFHSVLQ